MTVEKEKPYLEAPSPVKTRGPGRARSVKWLVIAGVILVGTAWFLLGKRGAWEYLTEDNPTGPRAFGLGERASLVDRVVIRYPGGHEHELMLLDDKWSIRSGRLSLPISKTRQRMLFQTATGKPELARSIIGTYQGNNPANHEHVFGVTERSGLRVRFHIGNDLLQEWIVSLKSPRDENSSYLRLPDSSSVYLVDANLRDNFAGERLLDWRRRWVFEEIEPEDITAIEVHSLERNQLSYGLRRDGQGWRVQLDDGLHEASPSAVAHTLGELANLRILDYVSRDSGALYAEQAVRVAVSLRQEDRPREVTIGLEMLSRFDGLLPARLSDTGDLILIGRPFCLLRPGTSYLASEKQTSRGQPSLLESLSSDQGDPVDLEPPLSDPVATTPA